MQPTVSPIFGRYFVASEEVFFLPNLPTTNRILSFNGFFRVFLSRINFTGPVEQRILPKEN